MISTKHVISIAVGALVSAFVVYQVKRHTKGILDDD